jgi:S-adenosylmethionine hydrolase
MTIITLTTDFNITSEYVAAIKGVILNINPNTKIVDITHAIQPQNILQGAFVLYSIVKYFPKAIHVGVIDPGVGTNRAGLIFKCQSGLLIGPDNGLLVPAAERLKIDIVYKITNNKFCLDDISSTFHGRDIFAPVAAHLSKNLKIEKVGGRIKHFKKLDLFGIKNTKDSLIGKVLNIDNFGNIVTNLPKDTIVKHFELGDQLTISTVTSQKGFKVPFKNTYDSVPKGTLLALISSSGFLELAGNQYNANEKLNLQIGDKITLQK